MDQDIKDAFYEGLPKVYDKFPMNAIKVVLVYLNAKLGKKLQFFLTLEKESLHGTSNCNELRLIIFTIEQNLILSRTKFSRKIIYKSTWK